MHLLQKNSYNHVNFHNSFSIIDIFNKAGFKTYWISNQNFSTYSVIDPHNLIALDSYYHKFIPIKNKTFVDDRPLDEVIFEYLEDLEFDSSTENVVFIHLMGSHAPYRNRFSSKFDIFSDNLIISEYENSIIYGDFIIKRIIVFFEDKNWSDIIYFSDHGENPGVGRDKTSIEMFKIPVFVIFNSNNELNSDKIDIFIKNSENKFFTNDLIFDTIIGLYGIDTNLYDSKYDFSSPDYIINSISDVKIDDGRYLLKEKSGFIFIQQHIDKQ